MQCEAKGSLRTVAKQFSVNAKDLSSTYKTRSGHITEQLLVMVEQLLLMVEQLLFMVEQLLFGLSSYCFL